jgi:hypothetical protein
LKRLTFPYDLVAGALILLDSDVMPDRDRPEMRGYIERQCKEATQFKKMEKMLIPETRITAGSTAFPELRERPGCARTRWGEPRIHPPAA